MVTFVGDQVIFAEIIDNANGEVIRESCTKLSEENR